jgi:hypothetical protein
MASFAVGENTLMSLATPMVTHEQLWLDRPAFLAKAPTGAKPHLALRFSIGTSGTVGMAARPDRNCEDRHRQLPLEAESSKQAEA